MPGKTRPEIVAVRMLEGEKVPLSGAAAIRIEKTKEEDLFAGFAEPGSDGARLAEAVAGNPLLLKLMFLKSEPARSPGTGRRATAFSFFLNSGCADEKRFKGIAFEEHGKRLEERIGGARSKLMSSYDAMVSEWLEESPDALTALAPAMRGPRKTEKAYEDARKAIIDGIRQGGIPMKSLEAVMAASYELDSWSRLDSAIHKIKNAQKNTASLASETEGGGGAGRISAALSEMGDLAEISTEAVCLDCWYEESRMPFMLTAANTGKASLQAECPRCGGTGLLHTAIMELPESVKPLMLEGRNWLPEILVGYVASQASGVRRVFIHKKIQAYDGGNVKKGVEADVSVISDDGRLCIIEVTTQYDDTHINDNIMRKKKNFKELGIPFERIVYVTAAGREEAFYPGNRGDTWILQMKHLTDLAQLIEGAVAGGAAPA